MLTTNKSRLGPDKLYHNQNGPSIYQCTQTGKRVVAFCTDVCWGEINRQHDTVFHDGTFQIAPKHFRQLRVLRGYVRNTCVVHMYFLLKDKSEQSYTMVDFEPAEHSAVR